MEHIYVRQGKNKDSIILYVEAYVMHYLGKNIKHAVAFWGEKKINSDGLISYYIYGATKDESRYVGKYRILKEIEYRYNLGTFIYQNGLNEIILKGYNMFYNADPDMEEVLLETNGMQTSIIRNEQEETNGNTDENKKINVIKKAICIEALIVMVLITGYGATIINQKEKMEDFLYEITEVLETITTYKQEVMLGEIK